MTNHVMSEQNSSIPISYPTPSFEEILTPVPAPPTRVSHKREKQQDPVTLGSNIAASFVSVGIVLAASYYVHSAALSGWGILFFVILSLAFGLLSCVGLNHISAVGLVLSSSMMLFSLIQYYNFNILWLSLAFAISVSIGSVALYSMNE